MSTLKLPGASLFYLEWGISERIRSWKMLIIGDNKELNLFHFIPSLFHFLKTIIYYSHFSYMCGLLCT